VLTAADANYSNDKTSVMLDQPVVTMTSSDGKPVTVQAPKAELKMDGNKVKRAHLTGGTQIHYGEFVLTTDEATFLPDQDEFDAPGLVTITGDGIKVTGIGMTGHAKTRQFELLKQVTTEIAPRRNGASKKG
jgi:LPS export ABC transporter protein LptC